MELDLFMVHRSILMANRVRLKETKFTAEFVFHEFMLTIFNKCFQLHRCISGTQTNIFDGLVKEFVTVGNCWNLEGQVLFLSTQSYNDCVLRSIACESHVVQWPWPAPGTLQRNWCQGWPCHLLWLCRTLGCHWVSFSTRWHCPGMFKPLFVNTWGVSDACSRESLYQEPVCVLSHDQRPVPPRVSTDEAKPFAVHEYAYSYSLHTGESISFAETSFDYMYLDITSANCETKVW